MAKYLRRAAVPCSTVVGGRGQAICPPAAAHLFSKGFPGRVGSSVARRHGAGLVPSVRAIIGVDNVTDEATYDQCGLPRPGRTLHWQYSFAERRAALMRFPVLNRKVHYQAAR